MTTVDPQSNGYAPRRSRTGTAASFAVGLAAGAAGAAAGYALTNRLAEPRPHAELGHVVPAAVDPAWPQVFEALDTGVAVVDSDDSVSYANPGACALGVCGSDRLEPAALRSLARHVRLNGAKRGAELELERAGETVAVRVQAAPLPDGHVAVELIDVTEMHRVERVRRDFVANVGHELKTPVGALQLLAEALADAVDDPQAAARFTNRIQHESSRMARLVTELLELSRLQGAEPLPAPDTVSVDRVITEALDRGRTAAGAKDMTLERTGRRGLAVSGSEAQLATAVGNLVGNAVAYSPDETTVTVDVALIDAKVHVSVTDQGIG
ncbi:MAG: histidine kinase dimerization/phospho-acceptor domain-containing protein, partial [Stackebrandtia sp.]